MQDNVIKLCIPQAKNDYEKKGQSVQFELHPKFFEIFSFYLSFSKFVKEDWSKNEKFLFYHVTKGGKSVYSKALKYDDMRYIVLYMCQESGVDMTRLGTHSLRIGATTHVTREGVPNHVIDTHGRWAEGSRARQGYQRVEWQDLSIISKLLK